MVLIELSLEDQIEDEIHGGKTIMGFIDSLFLYSFLV